MGALCASSHIPIYANGEFSTAWRGRQYVDGGLTGFLPSPPGLHTVKARDWRAGSLRLWKLSWWSWSRQHLLNSRIILLEVACLALQLAAHQVSAPLTLQVCCFPVSGMIGRLHTQISVSSGMVVALPGSRCSRRTSAACCSGQVSTPVGSPCSGSFTPSCSPTPSPITPHAPHRSMSAWPHTWTWRSGECNPPPPP